MQAWLGFVRNTVIVLALSVKRACLKLCGRGTVLRPAEAHSARRGRIGIPVDRSRRLRP